MLAPFTRSRRHALAAAHRARIEARDAKRFTLEGIDGATLDTTPARSWHARARAHQLPASDRTGQVRA